jgi:multiple sugar transport system ATP-binding protein
MAELKLIDIKKSYGAATIIHGVDLASGCGKSTLLRIIAGLEQVSGGEIRIDGQSVTNVPASDRGLAMVFQSYALYPHMSVYKNMAFALENMSLSRAEIDQRVRRAAQMLQLTDYLDRKPKALSGGQRQRVQSCAILKSSCLTSRCRTWMRSCASPRARSWPPCTERLAAP